LLHIDLHFFSHGAHPSHLPVPSMEDTRKWDGGEADGI
jgi:hypothetical protein